jgi:hypothetical protein
MRLSRALRVLALPALAVVAACGSSSSGASPPVTADYADQVAFVDTDTAHEAGPGAFSDTVVVLSKRGDLCAVAQAGEATAQLDHFKIVVQSPGHTSTPPGTYPVDGTAISAAHLVYDDTCGFRVVDTATAGAVTLTAVDAHAVAGSFDVTLRSGSRLTGTFAAPACSVPPDAGIVPTRCVP